MLLSDPRNKVYEVSDAVGYDNPKIFPGHFAAIFICHPRNFEKRAVKLMMKHNRMQQKYFFRQLIATFC